MCQVNARFAVEHSIEAESLVSHCEAVGAGGCLSAMFSGWYWGSRRELGAI